MPAPGRSGSRGGAKQNDPNVGGKDFIIHGSKKSNSSQKQRMIALNPEESVNHRLKRSHILNSVRWCFKQFYQYFSIKFYAIRKIIRSFVIKC